MAEECISVFCLNINDSTPAEQVEGLIDQSKSFRLKALLKSPQSFTSRYEIEVAFTRDVHLSRLRNPEANTLVALLSPKDLSSQAIDDSHRAAIENWVGSLVVLQNPSSFIDGKEVPESNLVAFYVDPDLRGKGVGQALLSKALQISRELAESQGSHFCRIKVQVYHDLPTAMHIYEKFGFRTVESTILGDRPILSMENLIEIEHDSES